MNRDPHNAEELARFEQEAKSWPFALKPYVGPTHDLDLNAEWYCPNCASHPRLKKGSHGLYCPTFYEECEYAFNNLNERRKHGVWWSEGFKYPLSPKELKAVRVSAKERAIALLKEDIKKDRQRLKALESELEGLRRS